MNLKKTSFSLLGILVALALPAFAQDLPRFELGLGGGATSFSLDASYSGAKILYDGMTIQSYESAVASYGSNTKNVNYPQAYPYDAAIPAIHTDFLVRWPVAKQVALAYSNRVNFAFDDRIHRADYYNSYGPILTIFGLTGIEAEYYFNPDCVGPWVSGLAGLTVLNQPFVKGYFTQIGFGAGGSIGWRFSRKSALAVDAIYHSSSIPGITQDKVTEAGGSIEGSSSGISVSLAYRIGIN
jgi:hypothetical protein